MVNPIATFRLFRDIARRRPFVVGVVGLGLLGESARVARVLFFGGTVTVFGHSGAEEWRTADGESWIAAYVAWVGICGLIVLALAVAGWRAKRRDGAGGGASGARPAAVAPASDASRRGSGVVVRRREFVEKRPNRLGR